MKHRPYLVYQESAVEWLGELPGHWELKRLGRCVLRSDEKVQPEEADERPYVGLENVVSWTGRLLTLDEQQIPESMSNSFKVGDVLLGKLRPYLAKALSADFDGLCSTEFLVLKPSRYEQRYLLYVLLTGGFVSLVNASAYGAKMPRASWGWIHDVVLPFPPLAEQRAIAAFLDRETARIDALVGKKLLLLERLQEYRAALITRTVTRGLPSDAGIAAGLDPYPSVRSSDVEWLGEVPEHWNVRELKWETSVLRGSVTTANR